MNRAVYKQLFLIFGKNPGQWFGLAAEIIRSFLLRVFIVIMMAETASSLAAGNFDDAKRYTVYFLLAYIVGSVIGMVGDLVSLWSENHEYNNRLMYYHRKLTNKDMSFYRDSQTGYLASVFRQHLDGCMYLVRLIRSSITRTLISLTVPAVILWFLDWRLGVVAVAIVALQLVYINWSPAKANKYREVSHEIYRRLTGEVSDEITNIVAYKSAGKEVESQEKIKALAEEEIESFWLRRKTTTILDLPRSIITAVGVTIGFWIVIDSASSAPESVGLMVLTITYMFQIIRNVGDLPNLILEHDDLVTKVYPTIAYLGDDYETIKDPTSPHDLKVSQGEIKFEDVSFSYEINQKHSSVEVFKNFTLTVQGGEQVGVVGLSGAGKSTLASLLMRFDDVQGGAIKIDGEDIRNVRQSDLRQHIAYVPQEPLLFHRTVRENIAYFNDTATSAQIAKAAKAAHAEEFIEKLPVGYDTIVGERGVKLSGGQKQRIVIARAILKNAPIMLFDEATSALDTESEQIIQQALPSIIGKHTALVIAHRLSTVAGLDRIVVMHDGKVVEQGTHKQLLKQKGRYYSLWQKQIAED